MIQNSAPPEIGEERTFIPAAFLGSQQFPHSRLMPSTTIPVVTGRVVQVNEAHRWIRVAYDFHGGTLYECFKY